MQDKETVVLKINDDPLDQIAKAVKETIYHRLDSHERPGKCPGCNSPYSEVGVLVGDVCYDCAKLCSICYREPADPFKGGGICPECTAEIDDGLEVSENSTTVEYFDVELNREDRPSVCIGCDIEPHCEPGCIPTSDKCIALKDTLV
jgi:hypothetical protein